MHGYLLQLEDKDIAKAFWHGRHVRAVYSCVGVLLFLCVTASAGLLLFFSHEPPKVQAEITGNGQLRVENLAAIMQGKVQQPGSLIWSHKHGLQQPGFLSGISPGGQNSQQQVRYQSQQITRANRDSREEELRKQKEILARRRNPEQNAKYMQDVSARREEARKEFWAGRIQYKKGQDNLEQWKKLQERNPEKYKKTEETYTDEPKGFSIPLPLNPIGMPKFDNGERFDLKLPYVDNGYVAEDSTDTWKRFTGLLNFGGKKEKAPTEVPKKKEEEEEEEKKQQWWPR